MAVTQIIEKWDGRGSSEDDKGVTTLKRQWVVTTDSDDTAEPAVVNALVAADATAGMYAPHPEWPFSLCRGRTCNPHKGPRVWLVEATYSSAPFQAAGDGSGSPSPVDSSQQTPADERPPTVSISRKEVTKPLEKDAVTGDPVTNTVGDPFVPPPEIFRSHHVITWKFKRTLSQLSWSTRSLFMDSVNEDTIAILGRTYPALSLRCIDYSLDTEWDTSDSGLALFFALTVQAEFNPDGWQPQILNTGRRKMVGSEGDEANPPRLVAIVDGAGQPIPDPVPLDVAGHEYPPGGPVPPAEYEYVTPSGYVPREWSGSSGILF